MIAGGCSLHRQQCCRTAFTAGAGWARVATCIHCNAVDKPARAKASPAGPCPAAHARDEPRAAWCLPASQAHLRRHLCHNRLAGGLGPLGHQVLRLVAGGVRAGLIAGKAGARGAAPPSRGSSRYKMRPAEPGAVGIHRCHTHLHHIVAVLVVGQLQRGAQHVCNAKGVGKEGRGTSVHLRSPA